METYSISEAKKELMQGFKMYMRKDEKGEYLLKTENQLPYFLVGPIGVGKTQICSQAANELGVGFVSSSMVHHSRQSAMGLPEIKSIEQDGVDIKCTRYTLSEIIADVYESIGQGNMEGILLLDEYNCISETLTPVSLAFLQSKMLGSSKLPKGWMIVIAGNPPKSIYNSSARELGLAIMDRLRVLNIDYDYDAFFAYAKEQAFHMAVLQYLYLFPEDMYRCSKDKADSSLVTCRSWENLSDIITSYEELGFEIDLKVVQQVIRNDEIAKRFITLYRTSIEIASLTIAEDIMTGRLSDEQVRTIKGYNEELQMAVGHACMSRIKISCEKLFSKRESDRVLIDAEGDRIINLLTFSRNILGNEKMFEFYYDLAKRNEAISYIMYSGSRRDSFVTGSFTKQKEA